MIKIKAQTSVAVVLVLLLSTSVWAKNDDFNGVVKLIEQFYHVKHEGVPFLAKAGIKTVTTAARIKGGNARRIAEAGSVKVAVFEDQEFKSAAEFIKFRQLLNATLLETWIPFIQTLSATGGEQTYIFLQNAGDKFHVLLVTIERHEATVIQISVSPHNLALLMRDPDGMSQSIYDEATINDQE